MSILKKLFAKPEQPVVETKKPTDYGNLRSFMVKGSEIQIQEPWTLAQERLLGHAKDRGAAKGIMLYNNHKSRVQNQWINPMTSTNSGYSAVQNSVYLYQTVNYYECYILAQDPIFTKVFNKLSKTPFSKGGNLVLPEGYTPEQENALEKAANKYHLWDEVRDAVRSEYVTGGCLLYLDFGQDADELMEPLDLSHMNMRKFKGFRHIDPINVTAVDVNTVDPSRADYMKPKLWYVIGLGTVHATHFIKFEENVPELPMRPLTLYFGMPLTQLIKQDVANSNLVSQGVANLINRFRYIYMKVEDSAFVTNNAQQLRDKLEFMSSAQDNFGVCPLKQTEDVQQLTTSLAGLSENVEQCYLLLSAKTDIPYTELMGKSAQGMDATGAGDRRAWYDKCKNIQSAHKDAILIMYGIVAGSISDNGKFVLFEDYTFNPLEEATEKELADNIKSYTDVATALAGLGANPDSLIDWLKQFKQFHLDSIDFDTSTPGLEDYDGDDDPDGNPGGGMPKITGGTDIGDGFKVREDITPKVLEAVKAMNGNFNEPDHPRQKDGKFAPKGQGGSGEITVRGNELTGFAVKGNDLRTAAKDYYIKNLAGTSVQHKKLGEVLFSKNGYKKPISFSADERKLRLFPFLPQIIKNGKVVQTEKDRYNRSQVEEWVVLESDITYDNKKNIVRVNLRKDSNGRLYYDHVISKTPGGTAYDDSQSKGVNNSIGQEEWIVNLFIENKE